MATAGSAEIGRSETIQYFHGSEVAFWPHAQKHAAGIRQAIANVADTKVIFESTANGIGNVFHSEWKAAERGDSDFEANFIPWFWHQEYEALAPAEWRAPAALAEYEAAYDLRRSQTYWAWAKNRELAVISGASSDDFCWQFKQEYPANADEAFQTSGSEAFIGAAQVLTARKTAVTAYGPIILGVDPARGGSDKTGLVDRQGRRIGAHVRTHQSKRSDGARRRRAARSPLADAARPAESRRRHHGPRRRTLRSSQLAARGPRGERQLRRQGL